LQDLKLPFARACEVFQRRAGLTPRERHPHERHRIVLHLRRP
jgi:hypothetical protein